MVMQIFASKTTFILSIIITLLTAIVSAGGLLIRNLYNDNDFVKQAWYTNDIITLFVAVPLLIAAMILSKKGSQRWLLIWTGLLGYIFYNFFFFIFLVQTSICFSDLYSFVFFICFCVGVIIIANRY